MKENKQVSYKATFEAIKKAQGKNYKPVNITDVPFFYRKYILDQTLTLQDFISDYPFAKEELAQVENDWYTFLDKWRQRWDFDVLKPQRVAILQAKLKKKFTWKNYWMLRL